MGSIRLGCSGWDYQDWVGTLYERDGSKLKAYTSIFNTAEINSTFYSYPKHGLVENFLAVLPSDYHFALEYRNKTWLNDDVIPLLERYNVTPVMTDGPALPKQVMSSNGMAYIRWHGRGSRVWYNYRYSQQELEPWVDTIRELSEQVRVLGYFNNHYHGHAPENCLDVLEMLGIATPKQQLMLQQLQTCQAGPKARDTTLAEFAYLAVSSKEIEETLLEFTDKGRLERGRAVKDIVMLQDEPDLIVADVNGYSIYVDYAGKFILHDCQDWRRGRQRMCKHVAALILSLPPEKSLALLRLIKEQGWEFRPYTG